MASGEDRSGREPTGRAGCAMSLAEILQRLRGVPGVAQLAGQEAPPDALVSIN